MNKIFKSALVALVAVTGLTMASCVNEYEYDAATSEGSKVYFSKDLAETLDVSFDENEFQVPVSRTSTDGDLTVPVTVTMSEGSIFTPAASSVTFANGSSTAYLTFTYDPAKVEYGKYDAITVAINDATQVTTYGLSAYSFKAGKTEWKLMEGGKGTYRDDLMTTFGAETQIINVNIYESVVTAGKYMVEAPYDPNGDFGKNKMWSSVEQAKSEYNPSGNLSVNIVIDASDPNYVYFPEFDSGYNYEGSAISFLSYIQFLMDYYGYDLEALKSNDPQYFGKMEDNVITMPAGSVLFAFDREPWNYTNDNGLFAVALPGATIGDFSVEASFSGIFTDNAGKVFAVTEAKLGDDATNVKAVVMTADADASAVADAIAAGELEGVDIVDGANNVPIPEDMSGKLQVIIVVLNGKSVKNVVSVPFEYYAGTNPWESLGVGYYVDDFIVPFYGYDPYDYEVEIDESTETPGLYRIRNAYAPVAEAFGETGGEKDIIIHAENPNGVYFLTQPTGIDFGSGEFSIVSYGGDDVEYFGEKYGVTPEQVIEAFPEDFGTLEDGVITLPYLTATDSEGNIRKDSNGDPIKFQGYLYRSDGKAWYSCTNGAFALVLPSANAAARAKAKSRAAAAAFEYRLNGGASNCEVKNHLMSSKKLRKFIKVAKPFK